MEEQCDRAMVEFLELLVELTALERLRNCWSKEPDKCEDWRAKMDLISEMIEKRSGLRDEKLKFYEEVFPEIKSFDWMGSRRFDA